MDERRAPRIVEIGPVFKNKAGEETVLLAFRHPCWKDGCRNGAPFGFGVSLLHGKLGTWSCSEHRNELLALLEHPLGSQHPGGSDELSTVDRDLFAG